MDWMAMSSGSIPRAESPPRLTETTSSKPNPIHFVPQSEAPSNASPDQLLALFVALAAEINASPSIRDNNALENLVNKDVGMSNIHTAFVGNGSSFSVRVWRLEGPDQSLIFKSAMPSNHKFTHRDEKRRLADVILELRTLSHPALRGRENIVQLLGLGWETDSFEQGRKWPVLILEYAHGGTLKDFLPESHVSSQAKLHICQDIACGLAALHDVGVIHGDVKPENVLMFQQNSTTGRDTSWVAKLGDFGGAVLDLAGGPDILRTGTQPWNAPEWRKPLRPDDMMKTDIYSFGLVIFNIATDGIEFFSTKAGIFSFPANCVDLQERIMFLQNLKQDGLSFLAKLVEAGYSDRVRGMNGHLLEHLLRCTVQFVANLRSVEDVIATLEKETGRFAAPVLLKKWQRNPKTLADELVGSNNLDTLDPEIRKYVKIRLQDNVVRSPESWQRVSAAYNLAIEALADSDPAKAAKDCLHWLLAAAEMGSQSAQSIVYRFHIALDQTIPAGNASKIKQWVIDAAMRGYPAALEDVHLLASAEECSFVIEKLRRRYAGIGHNRFAFLYAGVDVPFDQWDLKIAEIIEERFKLHPRPEDFTLGMKHGDNIIHFAASAGLRNTINLWRQPRPIDINCKGDEDETALLHAARSGHYEVTMAILGMGGDPTIASTNGDTPLHWLLSYDAEHMVEIASQFCSRGANPNAIAKPVHLNFAPECTYESGTPLHRAVERGNLHAVRALLSVGARADDEGGRGYTPLNLAAFLHRSEILESLLSSLSAAQPAMGIYANMSLLAPAVGGEIFHGEKFSKIARHGASWWSQTASTLDILIAQGADKHLHGLPEGSMGAGVTALFLATTQGDARCVQYFLEHGCKSDVNVKSQYEPTATPRTPLNKAISSRRTESAIMLLKYGADPLALHIDENNDELTSVYECASAGHSDTIIVEQLVLAGAPVDDPGPSNYETPFACAVRNRSFVLASWFLKQGANPNIEYNKGFMFEIGSSRTLLGVLIMEQSLSTLACINFLIENVPETNFIVASIQGYTALHAVSRIRDHGRDNIAVHLILLRLLKFFKPTVEQVNQLSLEGYTALHFAVLSANFDVVRILVEKGADPNAKDASGLSPKDMINLTCGNIEEDPDTYIDVTDPRPRREQIILAKNRREKILHLFEGYAPKTHDIVE